MSNMCSCRILCCILCCAVLLAGVVFYLNDNSSAHFKQQQALWRLQCELGVINDMNCPVDGGWTSWSPWSSCRGSCDDVGHRRRTRHCINPPPSNDGLPCNGNEEEIELCYPSNCTVDSFRAIVSGDTARIQSFRLLEAVPAMMERCLQMECPFEAIEASLASDNTWQMNSECLWNALQCVKRNLGCPMPGEWGAWGSWSTCGARCGHGVRWRLRRCDSPPPSDAHLLCEGSPLMAEVCEGDQCATGVHNGEDNGNGQWSEWGSWTSCSEKCGSGVKRRRRACYETTTPGFVDIWGTHCVGQHDQFEVCENHNCILDGGWSGWSVWGPCSQTCGAGSKARTRTCTRPIPSGGGKPCSGPRNEIQSCNLSPCEAHSHTVAVMNGDSILRYNFKNKRATLLHFYVRFLVQSPHGTLMRRRSAGSHESAVRLSFQNWHLCLDASGPKRSCTMTRICSPSTLDSALWHTALITVTNAAATLRINDADLPLRSSFTCDPEFGNEAMDIIIGQKLHCAIHELALNFIPLSMLTGGDRKQRSDFVPSTATNIVFEKADFDEAFLPISKGQFIRLPCFEKENWRLEFTVKPKSQSGTFLFMGDDSANNWLHMHLQNRRLKVKITLGDYKSESASFTESLQDQWLDITLTKKKEANLIEASINSNEKIHVLLDDVLARKRRVAKQSRPSAQSIENGSCSLGRYEHKQEVLYLCQDEYYFGGVPIQFKQRLEEDFTPLIGTLASLKVDNVLQDLHRFHIERHHNDMVQVSSKTASISGSYHEIAWGKSNRLNLTCLHARTSRSPNTAQWLLLDSGIAGVLKNKRARSIDDGKVLRLVASADDDLRGFYTCRAHNNRQTRNIVTYGVIGKIKSHLTGPNTVTIIAVITTFALVVSTLGWLIMEGSNDLKNGFGFFRDAHLTPQEEAEAVCQYIDEHLHLYASKSVAELAKEKARLKGQQIASRQSFAAQEPQGLHQTEQKSDSDSFPSEPELPALPEIKSYMVAPAPLHEVYRCEPCYISSPRHGSLNTSPGTRLSSSSFELSSPRMFCSRLLMARRIHSSKESLISRRKNTSINRNINTQTMRRSNLLTIKSSAYLNVSPAHKILQKFQQLKTNDV